MELEEVLGTSEASEYPSNYHPSLPLSFQPRPPATSHPLPCHQNDLSETTNLGMVFSCLEKIDADAPLSSGTSPRALVWRGQEGLALASLPSSLPTNLACILAAHSLCSRLDGHMSLGAGTPTAAHIPAFSSTPQFLRSNTSFLPVIHPRLQSLLVPLLTPFSIAHLHEQTEGVC